jgi:hypothetical protein
VTVKRTYYCDLCGANGDGEPLRGLYWTKLTTRETLVEKAWREVEHHVCNKCLDDLRKFSPQPSPSPTDDKHG